MFCPAGYGRVARAARRAPPSDPPARATEQERPAAGPLGVLLPRRDPRSEPSTPHRGTPARDPHAPAKSASARWAGLTTTPPPSGGPAGGLGFRRTLGLRQGLALEGGGVVNPPVPRVAISLLRPRAPDGRSAPGCRWLRPSVSCEGGEQRGAPARIALSGRGRRSMRARARGRPGPHPATRGTGKQDSLHAVEEEPTSSCERPEATDRLEEGRRSQERIHPRGIAAARGSPRSGGVRRPARPRGGRVSGGRGESGASGGDSGRRGSRTPRWPSLSPRCGRPSRSRTPSSPRSRRGCRP